MNIKPKQINKMSEIKFDANECDTLKTMLNDIIIGLEVIDVSVVADGCDGYGFIYEASCNNRWSGRLHEVNFKKRKDVNKLFQTVLTTGWDIIKYEEEDYNKYEKLLQEKNVDIEYTDEGDIDLQGFTIHFTEDSLKKLFYETA